MTIGQVKPVLTPWVTQRLGEVSTEIMGQVKISTVTMGYTEDRER